MKFFERYDKVYCISLKRRQDRRESFDSEVKKYDLGSYEFFDAIDGKTLRREDYIERIPLGNIGLTMTTIKLLKKAIRKKYSTILLMEDDCIFTDEINNIQEYIDLVPENWDMLYFGGNHYGWHEHFRINEKILNIKKTHMAHCIAIKSNMFKILINELQKFETENDNVYMKIQQNYGVYCVFPSIAKQIDGISDIQNGYVNYLGLH
jgi:GR25 family glycosyltransferase involved in LPS biosynthesis